MERVEFNKILMKQIDTIRNIFNENEWCFRVSEANVRAEIIDPLLKTLGWELPYVKREFNGTDYMLCKEKLFIKSNTRLIIESKKYYENLRSCVHKYKEKNETNIEQIIRYCSYNQCFGILTNGIEWLLFNKNSENDSVGSHFIKDCLLGMIDIRNNKMEDICSFFYNLSYHNFHPEKIYNGIQNNEIQPNALIINKETFIKGQCEASYLVIEKAIEKNPDIYKESPFYRDIKPRKDRTQTSKKINGKTYSISGDYNIYDKYALLQEINCALDLGFVIRISSE